MSNIAGISETNRKYLTQLHRHTNGLVEVDEVARFLEFDRVRAAKLLAQFAEQGWARRLRRGLYVLIPLEATSPEDWTEDAWLVASRVFKPGYIAGWSACEYWGLTEQVFRDVAVFTTSAIRARRTTIDRTTYVLRKIPDRLLFGTRTVWRKEVAVPVSDPPRTLIDTLDDPIWGGGIRHVAQIIEAYWSSEHRNDVLLLDYLKQLGNAAAAKRLGYLLETLGLADSILLDQLQAFVTAGYARLDPAVPARGPFVARWNLRANVEINQ